MNRPVGSNGRVFLGEHEPESIKVIYSHPARQHNIPERPARAYKNGFDALFLTGLYFKPAALPYTLVSTLPSQLRATVLARLRKRRTAGLPDDRVISVSGVLPEALLRSLRLPRVWNLVHDWYASKWLRRNYHANKRRAIFHGFQGSCARSVRVARHVGMIAAVEITQPLTSSSIVSKERARLGLPVRGLGICKEEITEVSLADFIIVQSSGSMDGISEFQPDAKFVLLHLGVDTQFFTPARPRRGADGFQAICVGQVCVRKGVHHLLEAWRNVTIPGANLLIVGEPTDELGYRVLSERIPGVKCVGQVTAECLAELYQKSDVFVGPSLSEAGFNAVYEAGSSGLPCVVSKQAGSFVRDELEGFVVEVGDVASLTERLNALGHNPELRQRQGDAARRRAEALSWEMFGRRLARAYDYMVTTDTGNASRVFEA